MAAGMCVVFTSDLSVFLVVLAREDAKLAKATRTHVRFFYLFLRRGIYHKLALGMVLVVVFLEAGL